MSSHANKVDLELNNACRTLTGISSHTSPTKQVIPTEARGQAHAKVENF